MPQHIGLKSTFPATTTTATSISLYFKCSFLEALALPLFVHTHSSHTNTELSTKKAIALDGRKPLESGRPKTPGSADSSAFGVQFCQHLVRTDAPRTYRLEHSKPFSKPGD